MKYNFHSNPINGRIYKLYLLFTYRLHALSILDDQATLRKAIIDSLKDVAFLREDYPEDDFSSLINIIDESVFPGYTFFTDKHVG